MIKKTTLYLVLCLLTFDGFALQKPDVSKLDSLVLRELQANNITTSEVCNDTIFIRRIMLDVVGRIPTPDQLISFLADNSPTKREKVIDQLLNSEEFVDYQVLKWGDLLRCKSEFPSNLWPNAVQGYARWMRENIRENRPYNEFVRTLLLSSGSNFKNPEVNFYRAFQTRNATQFAQNAALLFMGIRPKTIIFQNRNSEIFAPFFCQVKFKKSEEWKEEFVYVDKDIKPLITSIEMPDSKTITYQFGDDMRVLFADWLTAKSNPYFAKTMANRIWFWLMGRGIVHEPDDMRPDNTPSNKVLLSYIESYFIQSNFDTKAMFRLILNSNTYQRSSATNKTNKADFSLFSHYPLRRLTAEQLMDAINDITEKRDIYSSRVPEPYTHLPNDTRAVQLEDGTISTPSLELFGRPSRDISYENDRNNNLNEKQLLFLLNSTAIQDKIYNSNRIKALITNAKSTDELTTSIYLLVLNRYPSIYEKQIVSDYNLKKVQAKKTSAYDIVWALINSPEFIFNH